MTPSSSSSRGPVCPGGRGSGRDLRRRVWGAPGGRKSETVTRGRLGGRRRVGGVEGCRPCRHRRLYRRDSDVPDKSRGKSGRLLGKGRLWTIDKTQKRSLGREVVFVGLVKTPSLPNRVKWRPGSCGIVP